jgi:hypothetical protein
VAGKIVAGIIIALTVVAVWTGRLDPTPALLIGGLGLAVIFS